MAGFLHGVETFEKQKGSVPVNFVPTAVVGITGVALEGKVNEPILITSEKDFAQFGVDKVGTTILDALTNGFKQKSTVCIVINVLDPSVHKTSVTDEIVTVQIDGSFKLANPAVTGVSVKSSTGTAIAATEYTLNASTGVGARVATSSAIAASTASVTTTLKVSYTYADPSKVTASDIIGGITLAGKRTGMKALRDSYALFGFFPKLLIAPVFSSLNSVAVENTAMAHSIKAIAFNDAPAGITPQQAITGRGALGTINFNTSSDRTGLCYPQVKVFDTTANVESLYPLSVKVAFEYAKVDQEKGFWWSASNQEIRGITGMERPIDAMINDPNSEANLLNAAGIITIFNSYGTGMRIWGNRSAAFPASTDPTTFICVRRTADVIEESMEYATLQFIDRPLDSATIDAIIETGNGFMRKLIGVGAVINGRVWFDKTLNTKEELANGHLTLCYDFMPPTATERVTYIVNINTNYLADLYKQAA